MGSSKAAGPEISGKVPGACQAEGAAGAALARHHAYRIGSAPCPWQVQHIVCLCDEAIAHLLLPSCSLLQPHQPTALQP